MKDLASQIADAFVPEDHVALFWLGQAGFVIKTSAARIVYVDPYLSEAAEARRGLKRIMPSLIKPEEVRADIVVSTHSHIDHLDLDALPIIARDPSVRFAGPRTCTAFYRDLGLSTHRYTELVAGTSSELAGMMIHSVYADHGTLAPDAVGVVLDIDGIRIYHTGDTAFRPDTMASVREFNPNVVLPCINGAFGNMDARDAARLVGLLRPRLAIPCHFWMFAEHGGDPQLFVKLCQEAAPGVEVRLMTQGEGIILEKGG